MNSLVKPIRSPNLQLGLVFSHKKNFKISFLLQDKWWSPGSGGEGRMESYHLMCIELQFYRTEELGDG